MSPKLTVFADSRLPYEAQIRWFPDRCSVTATMEEIIKEAANEHVSREIMCGRARPFWRTTSRPRLEDRDIPLRKEY